jgi:hypothetical protein
LPGAQIGPPSMRKAGKARECVVAADLTEPESGQRRLLAFLAPADRNLKGTSLRLRAGRFLGAREARRSAVPAGG